MPEQGSVGLGWLNYCAVMHCHVSVITDGLVHGRITTSQADPTSRTEFPRLGGQHARKLACQRAITNMALVVLRQCPVQSIQALTKLDSEDRGIFEFPHVSPAQTGID